MDLSGLKDLKTTIPGVIIILAVTGAMFKGLCSFDQWWQTILIIIGAIGGGGLLLAGKQKLSCPPVPPNFTDSSEDK
jgi:hypothetical protein